MDISNISALIAGYKSGAYTVRDVMEEVIRRMHAHEHSNVWIERVPDEALRTQAKKMAESAPHAPERDRPLWGVPFAVKDNIDVQGFPTTVGCREFARTPEATAPVVQRLLDAGALLVGKTNMDQFATGLTGALSPYGTPVNPYGKDYIPGGSSSGSAVAVSSKLVSFALGTDTGGSIRLPPGFNNIVGLKPSRGLLSTRGMVPTCRSLDCVGLMAADVRSVAMIFDVAVGFDPRDPFSQRYDRRDIPRMTRIGVLMPGCREFFGDDDAAKIYEAGAARLKDCGFTCVEVDFSPFREASELMYNGAWMAEREIVYGAFMKKNPSAVQPATRAAIESGAKYSAIDYFKQFYRLMELRRQTELETWPLIDALYLPTAPRAHRVEDAVKNPRGLIEELKIYTNFVNLLDLCAIAVPSGFTAAGIPVGATFVAPRCRDHALIEVGRRFTGAEDKTGQSA